MEVARSRVSIDYKPLDVACSMKVLSTYSPSTQVFNAKDGTYNPNRGITPTVILPQVTLYASDGSMETPYGNSMLGDMKWYVNDVDISTLSDWKDLYSISTDGSMRGAITIMRNVDVASRYDLRFEGKIYDKRTGRTSEIKTDNITLSTTDKSEDAYTMSISDDAAIRYNQFEDKLFLHEYKLSHGVSVAPSETTESVTDGTAYKKVIPISVHKGTDLMKSTDYTVKLFEVNSSTEFTELTTADNDNEVIEIASDHVTIDLRLITKADYLIVAYVAGKQIANKQFGVGRIYPVFFARTSNGTRISPTDVDRYDVAMVDYNGKILDYPEVFCKMIWYTDTYALKGVKHNEGKATLFTIQSTGIGNTYADDWLETYIDASIKEAFSIATDENGNIFTDESGNTLIFN